MKVFMLGWEFPPFISGGLGTACYGLTKAMDKLGIEITFVLPKVVEESFTSHVKVLNPDSMVGSSDYYEVENEELVKTKLRIINSALQPYSTSEEYEKQISELIRNKQVNIENNFSSAGESVGGVDYSGDMYSEIHRYAAICANLARQEDYDVIHAHDWMTYPAGMLVAAASGRPLVVHVHSTEFDRSGEHVNQQIYDIERAGMHRAAKIIAVSHFTKKIVVERYGIAADKVEVVHNGVECSNDNNQLDADPNIEKDEKVVLFLGRITMQKGPEYFLYAAKKVLEVMDDVKFVMAGSGDLMHKAIELAAELDIGSKVLFTGFLRGDAVHRIYKMADLFVMPSVSEPFGIVPLEALENDVPVMISKQSGVSEVLTHALKVDFWDVDEMANKIIAVLQYPPLGITLRNYGNYEVRKLRWKDSAVRCSRVYESVLA